MMAENREAQDDQLALEKRLLSREIISGHTLLGREATFRLAARDSGFTLVVIPEGEELTRAVDPSYDDEDTPIPSGPRKPHVETVSIPEGSFGYYIQRPLTQTNHGAFWEAVRVASPQS